jgi:hypothetical protein
LEHHWNQERITKVTPEALEKCWGRAAATWQKDGRHLNQEQMAKVAPEALAKRLRLWCYHMEETWKMPESRANG